MEIDTYINENVVFNPNYKLRGDDNNIIITNNDSAIANSLDLSNKNDFTTGFAWPIHPFIATMINFFDGKRTLKQAIEIISGETALSFDEVKLSISKIFLNQDIIFYPVEDKDISLPLPINVLILNNNNFVRDNALQNIDIDYIFENMDFKKKRLSIPNECTLMVNNTCYTNCIYCYVDKRHVHDMLPFERWKEIISEARKLNMRDCQINGGDLFSYKYWYELLSCLQEHNYGPYLSTKYPLTETMVAKLATLKIEKIQFSIDSVNKSSLSSILKVDSDYLEKIKKTLLLLQKYNISFCVKSVITKYNDSIQEIKDLIQFITSFENLTDMSLAPGEYSIHNDFCSFRTNKKQLELIRQYVDQLQHPKVNMQDYMESGADFTFAEKQEDFSKRAACSANTTSFLVLPDGKVTYCEQTYWNPQFNMGDLRNQSIMEMWDSEKAKNMWHYPQDSLQEGNPCKTCADFERCRHGKGACFRLAYTAYGLDCWNYPPPQCPYAPKVTADIYIK